jgi:hypothetical protein
MDDAPVNQFFLEYIARPQTAEIFFEEVLMACIFYGMPILVENNKPRLLYHIKNRGYRGFSVNRPDKQMAKLTKKYNLGLVADGFEAKDLVNLIENITPDIVINYKKNVELAAKELSATHSMDIFLNKIIKLCAE